MKSVKFAGVTFYILNDQLIAVDQQDNEIGRTTVAEGIRQSKWLGVMCKYAAIPEQ